MDDGTLASGAEDNLILLWNSGRMDCCNTFVGHTKQVWDVIALDEQNGTTPKVVSCSEDRTIRVWNLERNKCDKVLTGHKEGVLCLLWLGGSIIVSGGKDDKIKIWNYKVTFLLYTF